MKSYLSQMRRKWNKPLNEIRNKANKKLETDLKEKNSNQTKEVDIDEKEIYS